jgi:hypothetical protein
LVVAREAALILETLDRHLRGLGVIRLLGGAALTLGYGLDRADDGDLRDMEFLLTRHTTVREIEALLPSILVPEVFRESWPRAEASLKSLLARMR